MENLVKDLLGQVIERLDKIQENQEQQQRKQIELEHVVKENHQSQQRKQAQLDHMMTDYIELQQRRQNQLDQVVARLDTIQNSLERQTQKPNILEEKLIGVTSIVEQEKIFMRDQLRDAQNEILARLSDFQETTRACDVKTDKVLREIQSFRQSSGDPLGMAERLQTQIEGMGDGLGEKMKPLQETSSRSTPRALTETYGLPDLRKGLQPECEKIAEKLEISVKAVIGAEIVWLGNQIDEKLSDISTTVGKHFEEVKEVLKGEITAHSQGIRKHVDTKVQECMDVGKTHVDGIMCCIPIADPVQLPRTYTFEFYVENFQDLLTSEDAVWGPDWYIDEFQSNVRACVSFYYMMYVKLVHDHDPRETTLSPWPCKKIGLKATLIDPSGDRRDAVFKMSSRTWRKAVEDYSYFWPYGHNMLHYGGRGSDEALEKEFGKKNAKNPKGAVVFRYEIDLW